MIVDCYSIFTFLSPSAYCLLRRTKTFIQIKPSRRSCDVIYIFKIAATESQIYFRLQVCISDGRNSSEKAKIYLRTKVRSVISIHGYVITTHDFGKHTATILEFYFRFSIWFYTSLCCGALHNPTKFYRHMTIHAKVISSCLKSNISSAAILDL